MNLAWQDVEDLFFSYYPCDGENITVRRTNRRKFVVSKNEDIKVTFYLNSLNSAQRVFPNLPPDIFYCVAGLRINESKAQFLGEIMAGWELYVYSPTTTHGTMIESLQEYFQVESSEEWLGNGDVARLIKIYEKIELDPRTINMRTAALREPLFKDTLKF